MKSLTEEGRIFTPAEESGMEVLVRLTKEGAIARGENVRSSIVKVYNDQLTEQDRIFLSAGAYWMDQENDREGRPSSWRRSYEGAPFLVSSPTVDGFLSAIREEHWTALRRKADSHILLASQKNRDRRRWEEWSRLPIDDRVMWDGCRWISTRYLNDEGKQTLDKEIIAAYDETREEVDLRNARRDLWNREESAAIVRYHEFTSDRRLEYLNSKAPSILEPIEFDRWSEGLMPRRELIDIIHDRRIERLLDTFQIPEDTVECPECECEASIDDRCISTLQPGEYESLVNARKMYPEGAKEIGFFRRWYKHTECDWTEPAGALVRIQWTSGPLRFEDSILLTNI